MKAKASKDINKYIEEIIRTKAGNTDALLMEYYTRVITVKQLSEVEIPEASNHIPPFKHKDYAQGNLIVNYVTTLEFYLKRIIVKWKHKWSEAGIKMLLDEKVSLGDAYLIFKNKDVEPVNLIAYNSTFQNLESIEHCFKCLTGDKFLNKLTMNRWVPPPDNPLLIKAHKEWRNTLAEMFALRHKIIHEGYNEPISEEFLGCMEIAIAMIGVELGEFFKALPNTD